MRKIYLLLAIAVLAGCASNSPLIMTSSQKSLLSSMTAAKADKILLQITPRTKAQSGVYGNSIDLVMKSQVLKAKNGKVNYRHYKDYITKELNAELEAMKSLGLEQEDHDYYTYDFKKIKSIEIISTKWLNEGIVTSKNGTQFIVKFDNGQHTYFDVRKSYADKLVVVGKFFSPNAVLLK